MRNKQLTRAEYIAQKINNISPENGCGKYLFHVGDLGDREMVLCGKRDYQFNKGYFKQCEECKKLLSTNQPSQL